MTYTMGSLFAGIGGFDLGFERAGFKTSWQVEIDPYCQKVLAKNFPEAERFGDIRECGRHNLKPVDVICGGFPCQDISNAGKRAGIEGERSGLWTEYARIIRELRPAYVLVENVAALLGRGMGVVLGDLAEIGYDAEWEVISAADVGAPHLRERIWILANAEDFRYCGWPNIERSRPASEQGGNDDLRGQSFRCGFALAYANIEGLEGWEREELRECAGERTTGPSGASVQYATDDTQDGAGVRRGITAGHWRVEPNVGRVAHGVPKRVDRLRGLGNSVVPQIPEMLARRIADALRSQMPEVR